MKAKYFYLFIIIGIAIIFFSIFLTSPQNQETLQKESHYTVNLKPNPFYEETTLSQNLYPSEGISSYSIDIAYQFSNPQNKTITYEYEIFYELIGTVPDKTGLDQTIWKKTIPVKAKIIHQTTKDFSIKENILVDYTVYNQLARSYEEAYGLSINSILKVKIPLTYTIEGKNENIQKESVIEYVITLDDVISSIEETKEIENPSTKKEGNLLPCLGILSIFIGIGLIIKKKLKRKMPKQKENQLLKEYKHQIISVDNIPNITNVTVFELSSIEDFIRLATQYEIHIIYQTQEKCFYLFLENCVYLLKDSSK